VAVVTQNVTPGRTYQPFEGMNEATRLQTAVPRGLVRFASETGLSAKPVNDSIDLQLTCTLPGGFAYVISALAFDIEVDTATDWDPVCQGRVFNGIGGAPIGGNTQFSVFNMSNFPSTVANDPKRILNFSLGDVRTWYPGPVVASYAAGPTFIINYHNSAAAVMAVGSIFFHMSAYQYELNQAVRYPLNYPIPVGIR